LARIEIPIEISATEEAAIKSLLERIEQADVQLIGLEHAVGGLETAGGESVVDELPTRAQESQSAIDELEPSVEGGQSVTPTEQATPGEEVISAKDTITTPTDRTFAQPFQRDSRGFAQQTAIGTPIQDVTRKALPRNNRGDLQQGSGAPEDIAKQNAFKQLQQDVIDNSSGLRDLQAKFGQGFNLGQQALGLATLGGGGSKVIDAVAKNPLIKATGIGGIVASMVLEAVNAGIEAAIAPGGPFDRRFIRLINEEMDNGFRSREQKGFIRLGAQEIRITTGGSRASGKGQVSTTLEGSKSGFMSIENDELSLIARGQND
jgi:hypothetical protein